MDQIQSPKTYSVEEVRQEHPMAYEKWTEDEDTLLLQKSNEGMSIEGLSEFFQRKQGAIRARLRKLTTTESNGRSNTRLAYSLSVDFSFDWISVFKCGR